MPEVEVIHIIGTVPIPVGHEVEITYFKVVERSVSMFGADKDKVTEFTTPQIVDRTTGVVYGHFSHHGGGSIHPGSINVRSRKLGAGVSPRKQLRGKVRACQVTTIGFEGRETDQFETLLEVELA